MDFITQYWEVFSFILPLLGGAIGWVFGMKSRKLDFQKKAFQINSEMIDSVRSDYLERVNNMKDHIKELAAVNEDLEKIIGNQREYIESQKVYINKLKLKMKNEKIIPSS